MSNTLQLRLPFRLVADDLGVGEAALSAAMAAKAATTVAKVRPAPALPHSALPAAERHGRVAGGPLQGMQRQRSAGARRRADVIDGGHCMNHTMHARTADRMQMEGVKLGGGFGGV